MDLEIYIKVDFFSLTFAYSFISITIMSFFLTEYTLNGTYVKHYCEYKVVFGLKVYHGIVYMKINDKTLSQIYRNGKLIIQVFEDADVIDGYITFHKNNNKFKLSLGEYYVNDTLLPERVAKTWLKTKYLPNVARGFKMSKPLFKSIYELLIKRRLEYVNHILERIIAEEPAPSLN